MNIFTRLLDCNACDGYPSHSSSCFHRQHIDYCNAILYGVSTRVMRCLQMALMQLLINAGKIGHIIPVLCNVLHRLPMTQQILFKVAAAIFDLQHRSVIVQEHLCPSNWLLSGRTQLRSANKAIRSSHGHIPSLANGVFTLRFQSSGTSTHLTYALHQLPVQSRAKTHLFHQAYATASENVRWRE